MFGNTTTAGILGVGFAFLGTAACNQSGQCWVPSGEAGAGGSIITGPGTGAGGFGDVPPSGADSADDGCNLANTKTYSCTGVASIQLYKPIPGTGQTEYQETVTIPITQKTFEVADESGAKSAYFDYAKGDWFPNHYMKDPQYKEFRDKYGPETGNQLVGITDIQCLEPNSSVYKKASRSYASLLNGVPNRI